MFYCILITDDDKVFHKKWERNKVLIEPGRLKADGEYPQTMSWNFRIFGELDIITDIKINRIRWACHVQRIMDNEAEYHLGGR